jgi:hypothetical protein
MSTSQLTPNLSMSMPKLSPQGACSAGPSLACEVGEGARRELTSEHRPVETQHVPGVQAERR